MPGFFGTNNPTPWANPVGMGAALGAGGANPQVLGGLGTATGATGVQTGGGLQGTAAAGGGAQQGTAQGATQGALGNVQGAQGAAQGGGAVQGAGGGGVVPFGTPGTGGFGGTAAFSDLPPETQRKAMEDYVKAGMPNGPFGLLDWYNSGAWNPASGGGGGPPVPPVNLGNQLGGALTARFPGMEPTFTGTDKNGGSLFSFLPGRSGESEGIAQFLANWLAGQATEQRPRSDEMENIFRMVQAQGADSPFLGLAGAAAGQAQNRISPDALAGYEADLRARAASDAGQGYQTTMQRLRDAGQLGRGGMSVDPALAASNAANSQLGRANLDISGIIEQLTGNRLQQAGDLARGGAGVQESMLNAPSYNLAQTLGQQKYGGDQPLLNLLQDMMYTAIQGDVASRSQPSGFEKIGVPLLSGAMSGASGIGDLLDVLRGF